VGLVAAAAGLGSVYAGNFSYELNTIGLLFAAPHVPLGMAATLELAQFLTGTRRFSARTFGWVLLLGAGLALLHPFHVPVLLLALGLVGFRQWLRQRDFSALLACLGAAIGAVPVLVPTVLTFSFDPFWAATYTTQNLLPSPVFHELLIDVGATLVVAVLGLWFLRGQLAAPGLLLWALGMYLAMYVPVPYQRRLSFGLHPVLALLAANTLVLLLPGLRRPVQALVRVVVIIFASFGSLFLTLVVLVSTATGGPVDLYRSTPDLDAAAQWLGGHVQPGEVILADWDTSNYLAARTDGSVIGGHPVATLHPDQKRFLLEAYYAHQGNLDVARRLGASWVVYGPGDLDAVHPAVPPAFESGTVAVYRVPGP
jgi:hypothetical protein